MSEYYLADQRARERARQRGGDEASSAPTQSQNVKVTLLGDFVSSGEPQGFDPYNNVHGKAPRDAWRGTRGHRK